MTNKRKQFLTLKENTSYMSKMEIPVHIGRKLKNGLFAEKDSSERYFPDGNLAGTEMTRIDGYDLEGSHRELVNGTVISWNDRAIGDSGCDLIREVKKEKV